MNIYEALQAHTDAQHRNASCEIADRIARDARVGDRVAGARRDDKGTDLEEREAVRFDGVSSDDRHVCTQKGEVLIEVPSERVKVIDHKHVQWTGEVFRKRHEVRGRGEIEGSVTLDVDSDRHRPRLSVRPVDVAVYCISEERAVTSINNHRRCLIASS